jgi:hypothetical protein
VFPPYFPKEGATKVHSSRDYNRKLLKSGVAGELSACSTAKTPVNAAFLAPGTAARTPRSRLSLVCE